MIDFTLPLLFFSSYLSLSFPLLGMDAGGRTWFSFPLLYRGQTLHMIGVRARRWRSSVFSFLPPFFFDIPRLASRDYYYYHHHHPLFTHTPGSQNL